MTFSILATDTSGLLGVASTSHAFSVGSIVTSGRPGVGVVATQSFTEISYGPLGLDLLADGVPADEVLGRLLTADPHAEIRQVAFLSASGGIAAHTGTRCVPSAGSLTSTDGRAIAIGNMLASDDVLPATLAGLAASSGDLADRLVAGLIAGQASGGDARGTMSASLLVVEPHHAAAPWFGTVFDLRVDLDPDPLGALRRALAMSRAYDIFADTVFAPGRVNGPHPLTGPALDAALASLDQAQVTLGSDVEPTVWQGVLLLRGGDVDRGCDLIAAGIAQRAEFAVLIDGLRRIGAIPLDSAGILRRAAR